MYAAASTALLNTSGTILATEAGLALQELSFTTTIPLVIWKRPASYHALA